MRNFQNTVVLIFVAIFIVGCGKSQAERIKEQAANTQATQAIEMQRKADQVAKAQKTEQDIQLIAFQASLKDPDSAKIRNVHSGKVASDLNPEGVTATCGEVNAKNGFGGYTGFEGFVILPSRLVPYTIFMQRGEFGYWWGVTAKKIGCIPQ